jgi:hypothetical protein
MGPGFVPMKTMTAEEILFSPIKNTEKQIKFKDTFFIKFDQIWTGSISWALFSKNSKIPITLSPSV